MLSIKVNNEFIDVGDTSITLKFLNPMFSDNPLNNAFSYSFILPITSRNKRIFKNVHRVDSIKAQVKYPTTVFFEGIAILSGNIVVKKFSKTGLSCYINNDELVISNQMKEINIRDLVLDEYKLYDHNPVPGTQAENFDFYWNSLMTTLNDRFNNDDTDTHCFPPMIMGLHGYNEGIPPPALRFNYVMGMVNPYIQGSYRPNNGYNDVLSTAEIFWSCTYIPFVKYNYVLKKLFELFNITVISDFIESIDMKQLSIFNRDTLDSQDDNLIINEFKQFYKLQDYLPNVTGLDVVDVLKNIFNQVIFIKNNIVTILPIQEILNTPIENFTKYVDPFYSFTPSEPKGISLKYDNDSEDPLFDDPVHTPAEILIGDGGIKIVSKARYLFSDTAIASIQWPTFTSYPSGLPASLSDAAGEFGTYSVYRGKLKTDQYPYYVETTPPHLLGDDPGPEESSDRLLLTFYRGSNLNALGNPYPLATPFSVDQYAGKVGNLSLAWDGEDGLYETFWKDWLNLTDGAIEIDKTLVLPIHKIIQLISFRNPKKRFDSEDGPTTGIVKEVTFTIGNEGLSKTSCTFIAK